MDDEFSQMVKDLQQKIDDEEEQTYSSVVINEYRNPTHFGVLQNPDATGEITGPCHDTMKITLQISQGVITKARFWTDGCGATLACGNMLMNMVEGKTIEYGSSITKEDLIRKVDGLPKEHLHCAKLAVDTLRSALKELIHSNKKARG